MLRRLHSLAAAITMVSIAVALTAVAVITIGVLVVAQSTFDALMTKSGTPAAQAHAMFDHGVATIFAAASVIAVVVSVALAVVLAARLALPLRRMARAAERIAGGDYTIRVRSSGPDELASLAESFNRMALSLAEQEQQRKDFIVNAAHELRTPLTNLQGYLEALRDGVIAPSAEQFGSLHEEAQRLVRLSQSLDALADGQGSDRQARGADIDIGQAVRSAVDVARPAFDAKEIEVDVSIPARAVAHAEPDGIAQVLGNLLQNAARYTPRGGRASIEVVDARRQVTVSVTNTGDGIPPGDLSHVFERFYRVEKSRDAARGGAGIGLAIVKQLVEASGGRVGVDSSRGLTRFWFSLPAS